MHGKNLSNLSNEDSMLAGMGRTWRMWAGGMLCTCGRDVDRVWVDVVGRVTVANRDCAPLPSPLPLLVLVDVLFVIVGFAWGPPPLLEVVDAVVDAAVPEAGGGFPPALICTWMSAWIGAAFTTAWIRRAICIWALLLLLADALAELAETEDRSGEPELTESDSLVVRELSVEEDGDAACWAVVVGVVGVVVLVVTFGARLALLLRALEPSGAAPIV